MDKVPYDMISGTQNLNTVKKALCNAIQTPNKGSILDSLLFWTCNCAIKLAYIKEKRNNAESTVEKIKDFLNYVLDITGNVIYAGMVNIVKLNNLRLYSILGEQKETVQNMVAEPLKTLYITYANAETPRIVKLFKMCVISDKLTYR